MICLLSNVVCADMEDTVRISPGVFWGATHWNIALLLIGKGYHLVEEGLIIPGDVATLFLPSPGKFVCAELFLSPEPTSVVTMGRKLAEPGNSKGSGKN